MNNRTIFASVIGILVVLVVLVAVSLIKSPSVEQPVLGNFGGEAAYATTTDQFAAATVGSSKVLKTGPGVLEHVVITNETAGSFNLYDATSTKHGDHATTTLAKISASLAEGTYDFQVAFSRGLLVEFQSTNVASSTITWK